MVNVHRPKHNFTWRDLNRLLVTLWTRDDLIFIPERYRLQYNLIIRIYCWTGARLSAFFTGGFRYGVSCWDCFATSTYSRRKDIDLVLQRVDSGGWRLIYQVKQRWVKNNRDPEHTQYVLTLRFAPPAPHLVPSLACFVYANSRPISASALPGENMKSLSTMTQPSFSVWQLPTMPSLA